MSPPPAVQPEASRRRLSLLPVYVSAAMLLVFALATAFLGSGDRAPGEDPEPEPAIPAPADPEGEIGRVVTAFGEFLLNERPTRLAQDMPLAIDYGADLSTREAEIVFESVTGDRIEIGADTGVRATRSPLGVETLVLKWGTVEAELSARTHLSFRRFGTLQPSAGEKARVVVVAPREDTALGRRVAARSGDVLLSSRTLSVSIPDSATVTFFNDPGEDRRRRELRFKSEGPATREVRFRYPLNAGEVVVVASAGSSGTITMEGRAKLRVLNSPASPAGTEIRVETVRRGEREVRATIPPGRSAAIPLRRGPGNGRGENR